MIWRMPGLAAVVIVSLGVGIGVNTAVFSWIQMMVLQPIPGVADAGGVQLVEAARRHRLVSRRVVARVSRPARSHAARCPTCSRIAWCRSTSATPAAPERGHGLLVSGNYFSALGLRPRSAASCGPTRRAQAGGAPVVVISHAYWQTRFGGAPTVLGPHAARQRSAADDRRRHARALSGHGDDAGLRPLGAGDDGAGAVRRDRASSRIAASAATTSPAGWRRARRRAAAQTEVDAAMRQLAHDYPETNKTISARGAAVLAGAARTAAVLRRRAGDPAGRHAAPAARGLRQHREPDAGARERALPRDRRPPDARRRPLARRQPAADREPDAGAARRRRSARRSRSGRPTRCARCR